MNLQPGIYPFWFLNDRLSADEITRQIREMASQGIRGFYLHSRQGLEQPYLSESFFRMLDVALLEAEKHNMVVNFYDEYPYPSGIAGGEVTEGNPQFHATELKSEIFDCGEGFVRRAFQKGKILSCEAFPRRDGQIVWDEKIDLRSHIGMSMENESYHHGGLTPYNQKRYFASDPAPTLEYNFPEGEWHVTAAIQIVVENHKYWGNFVDPLNPEAIAEFIRLTHERYYARYGKHFGTLIHSIFTDETYFNWSRLVPERFLREYGYPLEGNYTAYLEVEHPEHKRIFTDLKQLMYRMFCESYDGQISEWCRNHNIRYCGEKDSAFFEQLDYMDIPGCEPGHVKAGAKRPDSLGGRLRGNALATASASYFFGKEGCLCECFHSLGWSGTLQDTKFIAESLIMQGITYLVPHGFFYSTHALKKHDAPPTFFFQMPYFNQFGILSKRFDRIWQVFKGKYFAARTLLLDVTEGMPENDRSEEYLINKELQNQLMEHHVEFVIGSAKILENGTLGDAVVHCRDLDIDTVIVPPLNIRLPELEAVLAKLRRANINMIEASDATVITESLWKYEVISGQDSKLWYRSRTDGKSLVGFFQNISPEAITLRFDAVAAKGLGEISLDDHDIPVLALQPDGSVLFRLEAFGSCLLAYGDGVAPAPAIPMVKIPVTGKFTVTPENLNVLRINDFFMQIRQADGKFGSAMPVQAMPIANQLAQGGFEFSPKYRFGFGRMPALGFPELTIRYEYTFDNDFDGSVLLVMEPGSLRGDWSISINNSLLNFTSVDAHVKGSLGAEITSYLKKGLNTVTVECVTDRMDGGLRNPLYLAGKFGVERARLTSPVSTGEFEDYIGNKLPFFSGTIGYEGSFFLNNLPEGEKLIAEMSLPDGFEESLRVSINEGEWQDIPWNPRSFMIDRSWLHVGENKIALKVATTLIRSFEGQYFDAATHCHLNIS